MKAFVTFSLIVLLAVFANSAQPKRSEKNSNLAVMLAYRPNSEIRTKDKTNNKTWTYNIDDKSISEESVNVNDELLSALIKERFAKRLQPNSFDDRKSGKTVKRENNDHDDFNDLESHESHEEYQEADAAEIVEVSKENEKKTCYKNTYKNVLNAFESALKNQIENYKKCVCQKKKNVATTETTTTTSTTESTRRQKFKSTVAQSNENDVDGNEKVITSALEDKKNIVCFHKQHAFHLTKLLDLIPCHSTDEPQPDMEDVNDEPVRRSERNNAQKYPEPDSESIEIDIEQITSKPKTTTLKPVRKLSKSTSSIDDKDKLNKQILELLKEHLNSRKTRKSRDEKNHKKQTSPKKITIKAKAITNDEELEDKNASEESVEEFHEQEFVKQLQALFLKYKIGSDEAFPMQSNEHSIESASSMPLQKFANKSSTVKNAVTESSDESIENSIKLKSRKFEKMHQQLKGSSRKTSPDRERSSNVNIIDNNQRKSYRSFSRSKANDEAVHSVETKNVSRSNNAKKSNNITKSSSSSTDNRSTSDLAKKVSNFARGKSSSRKN